jgi:Tfp pilus assembly protein PilF
MSAEKTICPSCGSANSPATSICDICGENLTTNINQDTPAVPESAMSVTKESGPAATKAVPAPPSPTKGTRQAAQVTKKNTAKQAGRTSTMSAAPLFSTMQWIAITLAAFILGGVVTASFLQSTGKTGSAAQDESTMAQQGSQPDLGQLNAAKAALDANPNDQNAMLGYANALHDADMLDQAIVQYKRYLEANPDDPDARVDLGICYFEKKEFSSAIAEMEQAIAKHPEHQLGTYNLGIVNLNAGNKAKAREWFTRARDMDPNSAYGKNATQLLEEQF